jgi:cytochrome c oxidase subunit I+III
MIVTTPIDARPTQCLRVAGPSYITLLAALFTGGVFIFPTYKLWWLMAISAALALGTIIVWLWTGTALRPEKEDKHVGLGLTLPLYASGPASVGWWAMFITMLGIMSAFFSLVFGYFFYWTIHEDFPPDPSPGPGVLWPAVGGALVVLAWALTSLARRWNRQDRAAAFYVALLSAGVLAVAAGAALVAGPWLTGLDPTHDVYGAIVWLLTIWTVLHLGFGLIMQLYCAARRVAGRMTARHDIDIANVALFWHFVLLTASVTVLVIAGFPLVA